MEQRRKIDHTLKERHGILQLLESLKREELGVAELEEIGTTLRSSGKRALFPIFRRLWRENNGELISKYAYLLDFFDEEGWVDQLAQLVLRRRDLEEDGKVALLAALEEYGVDVSAPPFHDLLARRGCLWAELPQLLDLGEEGLALFLEELLSRESEGRLRTIRDLTRLKDPRIPEVLQLLLFIDDAEIRLEAVTALGRVRSGRSAAILQQMRLHQDRAVREKSERSLRRLSFLGIVPEPLAATPPPPLHSAFAEPVDSTGTRGVWLIRQTGADKVAGLYLQLHETDGVTAAWGSGEVTIGELEKQLAGASGKEGAAKVPVEYALAIVSDGIFWTRERETFLPPQLYPFMRHLPAEKIVPARYVPEFPDYDLERLRASAFLVAETSSLLEDDFFAGWPLVSGRVCDFAQEWTDAEVGKPGGMLQKVLSRLVDRFVAELLVPESGLWARRLYITADLMAKAGRDRKLVEQTLTAAVTIAAPTDAGSAHPFLRRLAQESIQMARDLLDEGYDVRDDEGDWE